MKLANFHNCTNLDLAECANVHSALKLIGETEEAAGTKRTRKAPEPAPEVIDNRPAPPQATLLPGEEVDFSDRRKPGQERVRPLPATELPPEEPPQLPKTNTHHTPANRRTPDARETDRVGLVSPDDPRTVQDGHWYAWSEERNRLLPVSDEEILRRADEIRGQMIVESAASTTPVVEHKTASVSSKRFIPPTADEVSAYSDEISAGVDGQQFVDFYSSKGWMIGKNKMKDWKAAVRTWKRSESQRGAKISTAVRSNRNWDEEIPEWKPTE